MYPLKLEKKLKIKKTETKSRHTLYWALPQDLCDLTNPYKWTANWCTQIKSMQY